MEKGWEEVESIVIAIPNTRLRVDSHEKTSNVDKSCTWIST